jgi:hypothetical protein
VSRPRRRGWLLSRMGFGPASGDSHTAFFDVINPKRVRSRGRLRRPGLGWEAPADKTSTSGGSGRSTEATGCRGTPLDRLQAGGRLRRASARRSGRNRQGGSSGDRGLPRESSGRPGSSGQPRGSEGSLRCGARGNPRHGRTAVERCERHRASARCCRATGWRAVRAARRVMSGAFPVGFGFGRER